MGDGTKYRLSIATAGNPYMYADEITKLAGQEVLYFPVEWGNKHEVMIQVSKNHPWEIFCLTCVDLEEDYHWKEFWKDGKRVLCPGKIVYEPFDENKFT